MNDSTKKLIKLIWQLGVVAGGLITLVIFGIFGGQWFAGENMFWVPTAIGIVVSGALSGSFINWLKTKFGKVKLDVSELKSLMKKQKPTEPKELKEAEVEKKI
jgi:MFS family permease